MLTLLCSIVRTKLIAVVAGQAGIGLLGLYGAAIEMLSALSQMGLRTSGVREISGSTGNESRQAAVRRVWTYGVTAACVGAVVTVVLSPLLSRIAFGDGSGTGGFACIGLIVGLNALTASRQAIMQGTGRLRALARASVAGTAVSLIVSVPAIYMLREKSIIAVLLIYGAVTAVASMYGAGRLGGRGGGAGGRRAGPRPGGAVSGGVKRMLRFGVYMTVADGAVWLCEYLFMSWLRGAAGENELGLYQAGHTLSVKYIGMIFTAIAMEYYPRLSGVAGSRRRMSAYLDHELRIVVRAAVPAAVAFIVLMPMAVDVLYSDEFAGVTTMVRIAVPATLLRAVAWCSGFVILSKGDGRVFLLTECVSGVTALVLNVVCYSAYGIDGLGLSFEGTYAKYTTLVVGIVWRRYGVGISWRTWGLVSAGLGVCVLTTVMLSI